MIKNVLEGSEVGFLKGITCWDLLRTHIFPRTRELPQFPISPKPGFETKQKTVHICTKKKFANMQSFWKKKVVFSEFFFATGLIFEQFLAPRSRFFEKVNGLGVLGPFPLFHFPPSSLQTIENSIAVLLAPPVYSIKQPSEPPVSPAVAPANNHNLPHSCCRPSQSAPRQLLFFISSLPENRDHTAQPRPDLQVLSETRILFWEGLASFLLIHVISNPYIPKPKVMDITKLSFENSYIPENPRTPKPLTFSKNRLRGAKIRSNISPVAKKNFRKNDFFFSKNFAYVQTFFLCICAQSLYNTYLKRFVKKNLKKKTQKKKLHICTKNKKKLHICKRFRSRFFERNNGLGDIGNWGSSRIFNGDVQDLMGKVQEVKAQIYNGIVLERVSPRVLCGPAFNACFGRVPCFGLPSPALDLASVAASFGVCFGLSSSSPLRKNRSYPRPPAPHHHLCNPPFSSASPPFRSHRLPPQFISSAAPAFPPVNHPLYRNHLPSARFHFSSYSFRSVPHQLQPFPQSFLRFTTSGRPSYGSHSISDEQLQRVHLCYGRPASVQPSVPQLPILSFKIDPKSATAITASPPSTHF
ncbi:hypothetical protein LXL04_010732 [Taraxacum kok-saghyz]